MLRPLRLLGAVLLLAALAPLAAAQDVDCSNVPPSTGAPDPAYAACVQPLAVAPPVEDPTDYALGINNAAGGFVRFPLNGPGTQTLLCPYAPPGGGFLNGGDFAGDDLSTWYGVDNLGQAIRLDVATCTVTQLGIMGTGWTGVTWDYDTNQFYGLQVTSCGSGSRLYTLDFATLTATPVGNVDATNGCGIALAAHPTTGVLYSYDIVSDNFLSINKTTGVSTIIGPLGFDANFGQGMDFDNEDDTCYLFAFNNGTFTAELRTANIATGGTTLVGTLGVGLQQFGSASVENRLAECDLKFLASDLAYVPGPPEQLRIDVTVRNNGTSAQTARLVLDYNRNGGPPQGTRNLGTGTLPAGPSVSRTINLPVGNAPAGSYNFTLRLEDASGNTCGTYSETVSIAAPRVGSGEPFPAVEGGPFMAEVAAASVVVSPNPFARAATLSFALSEATQARLVVYDALGREVAVLVDGALAAGTHSATFDTAGLVAGTYLYSLSAGGRVQKGRMTLTR